MKDGFEAAVGKLVRDERTDGRLVYHSKGRYIIDNVRCN